MVNTRMVKDGYVPLGSSPLLEGRAVVGRPHPEERLEVGVHLKRRAELPPLEELSAQPLREPVSRSDFAVSYGADPADVAAVEAFARAHGLDVVGHDLAHRLVRLSGRAGRLERAFDVRLVHVFHARRAAGHRTHLGPIHLPADLARRVQGVFGLDDRPIARSHARVYDPYAGATGPAKVFLAPQLAKIYGFPDNDGTGQSVALVELGGGYQEQDLVTCFQQLGLSTPRITNVSVNGGGNHPGSGNDTEVYLDVEVLGALVPGAEIPVYFSPGDNLSFLQAVKQAVHDPVRANSVISISWASPEFQWQASEREAMNETFHEAALLGVTVCVSSGDLGASSERQAVDGWAHVEFPASSPFALACGGTRLIASEGASSQDAIVSEVVWNDSSGSSGGGASAVFGVPPYQATAGVGQRSVNPCRQPGRGVPDVAGNADQETGYVLWMDGQTQIVGGTSAVAPLWAALVARLNEKLGRRLGFLNPALYEIARRGKGFRDVVQGNNANARWVGGYFAAPGWDACTGWGSPDGVQLLAELQALAGDGSASKPTGSNRQTPSVVEGA